MEKESLLNFEKKNSITLENAKYLFGIMYALMQLARHFAMSGNIIAKQAWVEPTIFNLTIN